MKQRKKIIENLSMVKFNARINFWLGLTALIAAFYLLFKTEITKAGELFGLSSILFYNSYQQWYTKKLISEYLEQFDKNVES